MDTAGGAYGDPESLSGFSIDSGDIFDTKEECAVRFTVKGKTEAADISGEVESAASHRIPVIGLYPAMENTVVLELLDKSGKVTDSKEITITTDELPDKLEWML